MGLLCLWRAVEVSSVGDDLDLVDLTKVLCYNGLGFGHGGCTLTCRHFELGCWGWWIAESNGRVDEETRGGGISGDDAGPSGLRG